MEFNQLSSRQLEVMRLTADGLKSEEIAVRLNIKHKTVKWHLTQIYGALKVKNRAELIKYYWESRRLVDISKIIDATFNDMKNKIVEQIMKSGA